MDFLLQSLYPMLPSASADNFIIGKFTKVGDVNENVKGTRGMKKKMETLHSNAW